MIGSRKFTNAVDLAKAIEWLLQDAEIADHNRDTVYIEGDFYHSGIALLWEETLSDGSKVANIRLVQSRETAEARGLARGR
jgi:hypothetical protein